MAHFFRTGEIFKVASEQAVDIHSCLPAGNYTIGVDAYGEMFLQCVDNFTIPQKLYGDTHKQANRILYTYGDRSASTGVMLTGEKGSGKALRIDQQVFTPTGCKPIGMVQDGDVIYGDDGQLTKVVGVYPQGTRDMFEIVFNDGSTSVADGDHLWAVRQTTNSRAGFLKHTTKTTNGKRTAVTKDKVLTTNEIKTALEQGIKHVIPLCEPINFPQSQEITIDRYLLGLLLGDGCILYPSPIVTTSDTQILEYISSNIDEDYKVVKLPHSKYDYRICQKNPINIGGNVGMLPNKYTTILTHLGLHGRKSNEKFIPKELKYDSIENRFALLQGLMDSDGTITKRGNITFTTVSPQLATDVVWLARSLGFRSSIQHARYPSYTYNGVKKVGQLAYTVQLTGKYNDRVFRLTRKKERIKKCSSCTKTIVDIRPVEPAEAVCIKVDNNSSLFVTDDFTVTHNTLLAKVVCVLASEQSIPTIIVNQPHCGDKFNKFIQDIDQECVVLFDEFEKVYEEDDQEQVLTLLDGVFPTKKLFIITCNNKWRVNEHMRNRPGRIYYMLDFKGLDAKFIQEYCLENLLPEYTPHTEKIVDISGLFNEFNFDMLKAVVEEINRFGETPQDVLKILNTKPEYNNDEVFNVEMTYKGKKVTVEENGISAKVSTNPLCKPISLDFFVENDDDGDTEADSESNPTVRAAQKYLTMVFYPSDIKKVDAIEGKFVLVNEEQAVLVLTRPQQDRMFYSAAF